MSAVSRTFKYRPPTYDDLGTLGSVLRARMTYGTGALFVAPADSGTHTFLPKSFADMLGIKNEGKSLKIRQMSGYKGGFEVNLRSIEILHDNEVFETMRNPRALVAESDIPFCMPGRESPSNVLMSPFQKSEKN